MNKAEQRHQLIRALITKQKIHTQTELQELLIENSINTGSTSKWEKRLEVYMEEALYMMQPVQHQVVIKTYPGLAQSFGSILDALNFPEIVATICGNDVCLVICEDKEQAQSCFERLKQFALPLFFDR